MERVHPLRQDAVTLPLHLPVTLPLHCRYITRYIHFAKMRIHPKLTEEASKRITMLCAAPARPVGRCTVPLHDRYVTVTQLPFHGRYVAVTLGTRTCAPRRP